MRIRRLLVANRGEIARRVFRTCRDLGIATVAVHSDADATWPFVREADRAVRLPGNAPAETYLRADLIVEAARLAGADAVHPGYGFLSESPDFARAVGDAGLTWIGPSPASMEAMASKVHAKTLMAAAGVPVLDALAPASLTEADLPVLVKASAGGGGRGMRVVRRVEDLPGVVEQASAEAASAFGDPTVFVEPCVEGARHVEVQVVGSPAADGDEHRVLVLGERDCSLQRRHQKVVEETPAPGLAEPLRKALHDAARTAAEAIGYVGAGTVEFLVSTGPDAGRDRFFFLEMNTRLQVEHPVTECVSGLDLVALQIAVAEARALPDPPVPSGHALEVRLYAEDPARGWQPQSGRLTRFDVPGVTATFANPAGFGLRMDSGVTGGDVVSTHYDAMLAKVVSWAPSREEAARRLAGALSRARVHGLATNRDLLVAILRDEDFLAGRVSTDLLEQRLPALLPVRAPDGGARPAVRAAALAAALALAERARTARPVQQGIPAGWRNVVSQPQVTRFEVEGEPVAARWFGGRDGFGSAAEDVRVLETSPHRVVLESAGLTSAYDIAVSGERIDVDGPDGHVSLTRTPRFTDPARRVADGSLLAPMPGSVVAVAAAAGDDVAPGQPLLVLEAMKMQHTITAPGAGVVADLPVVVGDQVGAGDVLAVVHAHGAHSAYAPDDTTPSNVEEPA